MSACFPVRLQPSEKMGAGIPPGPGHRRGPRFPDHPSDEDLSRGTPDYTADAIHSATVTILNVQGRAQEGSGPGLRRFQTDVVLCSAREIAAPSNPAAKSLLTIAPARPALRSAAQWRPG